MDLHSQKIVYWNEEDTEIKFFPTRFNVNIKHECRANITEPFLKMKAIHVYSHCIESCPFERKKVNTGTICIVIMCSKSYIYQVHGHTLKM